MIRGSGRPTNCAAGDHGLTSQPSLLQSEVGAFITHALQAVGVVMMDELTEADRGDEVVIEYVDDGGFKAHGTGRVCHKKYDDVGNVIAVTITKLHRDPATETTTLYEHFVTRGGAVEFSALSAGPEWSYVGQICDVDVAGVPA